MTYEQTLYYIYTDNQKEKAKFTREYIKQEFSYSFSFHLSTQSTRSIIIIISVQKKGYNEEVKREI